MYLKNIHVGLEPPKDVIVDSIHLVKGDYLYYHYGCDGFDDRVNNYCHMISIYALLTLYNCYINYFKML